MRLNRELLRGFLSERLGVDVADLADDTQLFATGLLDSFSMIELIMFIEEEEAGMRFEPTDVSLEHLGSIGRILAFLDERIGPE